MCYFAEPQTCYLSWQQGTQQSTYHTHTYTLPHVRVNSHNKKLPDCASASARIRPSFVRLFLCVILMDALRRYYVGGFLKSSKAKKVRRRLNSFADRLKSTKSVCNVLEMCDVFVFRTEEHAVTFLTVLINSRGSNPSSSIDPLFIQGPKETKRRIALLKNVVSDLERLSIAIIPLVIVNMGVLGPIRVYETVLLKMIIPLEKVVYYDMAGRVYKDIKDFEKNSKLPLSILCYGIHLGNGVYREFKYELVGWKRELMYAMDVILGASNLFGSIGLLEYAKGSMPLFGLLTAGSSLYLVARGLWYFSDQNKFKGFSSVCKQTNKIAHYFTVFSTVLGNRKVVNQHFDIAEYRLILQYQLSG